MVVFSYQPRCYLFLGISIPKGAIKDAEGRTFETLRFVVSTFPIDFQFLMQTGINNSKYAEWEFIGHHTGYHRETPKISDNENNQLQIKLPINNNQFQIIDVVVKITPMDSYLSSPDKN